MGERDGVGVLVLESIMYGLFDLFPLLFPSLFFIHVASLSHPRGLLR